MREIYINDIRMPPTRTLEIGGEFEAKSTTMASGKIVKDIIGWRPTLSASWEYVPAKTLTAVINAARSGQFVKIRYPDPSGKEIERNFEIEIGNQKIFKFVKNKPFWYNVELIATSQEVES